MNGAKHFLRYWMYYAMICVCASNIFQYLHTNFSAMMWVLIALIWTSTSFFQAMTIERIENENDKLRKIMDEIIKERK